MDAEVGIHEFQQNALDVVRRVEGGESVVVTVNGRPAARLVPVTDRRWRRWAEVDEVLRGPGAPGLADDLRAFSGAVVDTFGKRSAEGSPNPDR